VPTIIDRITKIIRFSVSDAEYDIADVIENPDLSAVENFEGNEHAPARYITITGDVVTLKDQAARDAVDAAIESDNFDAIADKLDRPTTFERAFAEILIDEFNTLRALHGLAPRTRAQLRAALRNKL